MKRLLTPDWTKDDRRAELHAEELNRHVHSAYINKSASLELVPVETFPIRPQSLLAVHSRHEISPVRRWNDFLRGRLKVEYIEPVSRLTDSNLLKRFCDGRDASEQRTCCNKLQKCAAIGHGRPPVGEETTRSIKRSRAFFEHLAPLAVSLAA